MTDSKLLGLKLYGKIISLKNRLELHDETGHSYTANQIKQAVQLVDQINATLDRRKESR